MKEENKTLAELYQDGPKHEFGDISLVIENKGGKLRGKFIFHHIEADTNIIQKSLVAKGLPGCFSSPPTLINSDLASGLVWDERYKNLGEIVPLIEKEIREYDEMMHVLGDRLALCASCPVFDRCYRIAELNYKRRQLGEKRVGGKWTVE
jgi:hypothetical protein